MPITSMIIIAAAVASYISVLVHNMHMFQQNGYKNKEHMTWLSHTIGKQAILFVNIIIGILLILISHISLVIVSVFFDIVILRYYLYLNKINNKKKLVYTFRVKRLIATDIILSLVIVAIVWIFLGMQYITGTMTLLVTVQLIALPIVNIINKPIESMITNHYINDAKKMLSSCPDLIIIGVTGSYGKTSVKFYLQTLLQTKFDTLVTPESYNTPMGVVKTIRENLRSTHQIFVCEMGARHVGDIKEICDIVHPKHGIITSIGPQHLETFYNIDNIISTKFELADSLPCDGILFVNGDNEYINKNASCYKDVIFYRTGDGIGYKASNIKVSSLGTSFEIITPDGEVGEFTSKLIGKHNVINLVGAISVAHKMGISLSELKSSIRRIQPVEHRMQMIERGAITIIDDAYNSNPVGSKAAVETLKLFDGIRILITPGMVELGDKEDEYNYRFGTYAADSCDYILLVGRKRTEPIKQGALESGFESRRCESFDTLSEALSYAYSIKDQGHKYILLENDLTDNYQR